MDINQIVTARRRLEGDLIIVDDFLNHRVEPDVMTAIGESIADTCAIEPGDLILLMAPTVLVMSSTTATSARRNPACGWEA